MANKKRDKLQFNLDLDVSLETSLLWNFKNKIGGTGSFSDTEFCPLSAVMGGDPIFAELYCLNLNTLNLGSVWVWRLGTRA